MRHKFVLCWKIAVLDFLIQSFCRADDANPTELLRSDLISQAQVAYQSSDFTLAVKLGAELVDRDRKQFGDIDPVTRGSIAWQRSALEKFGDYSRATELQRELVTALETAHGNKHWQVVGDRLLLDELMVVAKMTPAKRQKLTEVRQLMIQCRHSIQANSLHEGIQIGNEVAESLQELFGRDCWQIISVLNNLSIAAEKSGNASDAVGFAERALQVQTAQFGEAHPETAMCLNTLGSAEIEVGKLEEAESHFDRAVKIFRTTTSESESSLGLLLNNLGDLHQRQARFDLAISELRPAIQIRQSTLGPDHPDMLVSLSNLGVTLSESGELRDALEIQLRTHRARVDAIGESGLDTASSANNIGATYSKLGQFTDSIEWLEKSHDV